jgi:anti-sigma factor RsiW
MARYARIEGGDECERWLPLLSAIVDGEATPEQLMEVRPRLRHCTACRATVRELHATSAPLAALLPVVLAPAAADHGHERAAGVFVRLYEAVAGGIHERAASAALKLQVAAEVASAGKLAVIAASAAAIAGGGAVVVDGAGRTHPPHVTRAAQRTTVAAPSTEPVRVLSAHTTCRLQRRSLHAYLIDALHAHARGDPAPLLT